MSSPIKLKIKKKKYITYLKQSKNKNKSLKPKQNKKIFYIKCNSKSIGQYVYSVDGSMPNWYDLGDVFKTRIEAERELVYRQALQRVKEWIYEHDAEGEFKPNKYFRNFTIYFAIEEHKFRLESYNLVKKFSPFGYLKSEAACEQLIKEMDSDLRIIFNV